MLYDFTASFTNSEMTFLVGKSGCGKSSLALILLKLYEYNSGSIYIDNFPLETLSPKWLSDNIYVVEQQSFIFAGTVRENVTLCMNRATDFFSPAPSPVELKDSLSLSLVTMGVSEFVDILPKGLDTVLGTKNSDLSGGQRQRISLARARLVDAPIMIFDESTSALDKELRRKIMSEIREYRKGKTTIIISHQFSEIDDDDFVYMMESGAIVQRGKKKDLRANGFLQDWTDSPLQDIFDFELERNEVVSSSSTEQDIELKSLKSSTAEAASQLVYAKGILFLLQSSPSKIFLGLGLLFMVVNGALSPLFSFGFSHLLVAIVPSQNINVTLWTTVLAIFAVADGMTLYGHLFLDFASENFNLKTRVSSLTNILAHDTQLQKSPTYFTSILVNDAERVKVIITKVMAAICTAATISSCAVIWGLVTGWQLCLVGLSLIPGFYICSYWFAWISNKWDARHSEVAQTALSLMVHAIRGIKTVKVLSLESYFMRKLDMIEKDLQEIFIRRAIYVGAGFSMTKIFAFVAQGVLLFYGMDLLSEGRYTVQQAMTVLSLLIFSLVTLDQLLGSIPELSNAYAALSVMANISSVSVGLEQTGSLTKDICGALEFDGVSFSYEGNPLIQNLSLAIQPGEVVAIAGPSGSGKSTIAKLAANLITPMKGRILLDGIETKEYANVLFRANVALVQQMPIPFFEGTIEQNLLYALQNKKISLQEKYTRIRNACRACALDEFICALPDGYKSIMGNASESEKSTLSGGQLQRLGIARALASSPRILILDECTASLDTDAMLCIKKIVKDFKTNRSMTILIISHQDEFRDVADRTIHLVCRSTDHCR